MSRQIFFDLNNVLTNKQINDAKKNKKLRSLSNWQSKVNVAKAVSKVPKIGHGASDGSYITDKTLISNYVKEIISKKEIFFVSKKQIFSPLYVKDLIKIIYFFLLKKKTGIFHIGGPNSFSRYQVLTKILKKINTYNDFNPQIKIINLNKLKLIAKRPLNVSLNIKKLKRNINFDLKNIDFVLKVILKKINAKKFNTR